MFRVQIGVAKGVLRHVGGSTTMCISLLIATPSLMIKYELKLAKFFEVVLYLLGLLEWGVWKT